MKKEVILTDRHINHINSMDKFQTWGVVGMGQ